MDEAWVIWHRYSDGSGAHVERAYADEGRAKLDYALLTEGDGKASSGEWRLDKVIFIGRCFGGA